MFFYWFLLVFILRICYHVFFSLCWWHHCYIYKSHLQWRTSATFIIFCGLKLNFTRAPYFYRKQNILLIYLRERRCWNPNQSTLPKFLSITWWWSRARCYSISKSCRGSSVSSHNYARHLFRCHLFCCQ